MTQQLVNLTIDCKGLSCPMPIVKTKKAIDQVSPGQVLEVLATDPGSVADIKSWATRTGHQFIGTTKDGNVFKHYIRRTDPNEVRPESRHADVISNEELQALLSQNPVILDVREPMEYTFGHIPGAKHVPLGQLEEELESLRNFADQVIHVVCRSGNRSDTACQILSEHGFPHVKNVVPGMSEWTFDLEQSQS
ncbi:sulfurtransferase TusA family protein [Ferroacidibacillus organovorans]|nr:sulfurtransferase TusA family protein [Ferroacidibacillus organovorans]